jgi:hypothetical protein
MDLGVKDQTAVGLRSHRAMKPGPGLRGLPSAETRYSVLDPSSLPWWGVGVLL